MIDALFGSKTRVKLLHLFLSNPEKSFYVREITRLIDEQINSVRRELSNMLEVGVIISDSADNKLYYGANRQYKYYEPLKQIFSDSDTKRELRQKVELVAWKGDVAKLPGLRLAVAAGALVRGSVSPVDLLLVGSMSANSISAIIKKIERQEHRELRYTVLAYDEFYYRLSVRDKFIMEIINGACSVLVDTEHIISRKGEEDV